MRDYFVLQNFIITYGNLGLLGGFITFTYGNFKRFNAAFMP